MGRVAASSSECRKNSEMRNGANAKGNAKSNDESLANRRRPMSKLTPSERSAAECHERNSPQSRFCRGLKVIAAYNVPVLAAVVGLLGVTHFASAADLPLPSAPPLAPAP